ncbi:MAG: hypothetical protein K2L64_02000, partial [Ureaplasma sp.]|nr:hypothetical protein [Ureaplasma sp.]
FYMYWREYEYFYSMICKIKKETNKILSYLFKYYWNNDEESVMFIKEIFKQMFLKEMNLNYENKIQNLYIRFVSIDKSF